MAEQKICSIEALETRARLPFAVSFNVRECEQCCSGILPKVGRAYQTRPVMHFNLPKTPLYRLLSIILYLNGRDGTPSST